MDVVADDGEGCRDKANMKLCAYCNKAGKMTREELFPKSQVRRTPSYKANIDHSRPGKPLEAVQVIRDVCAECNNVRLGGLDAYGATLAEEYVFLEKPVELDFRCDTERLLRWLLKLLFNSVRVSGLRDDAYKPLCPFILGNTSSPTIELHLLIGLIEPFTQAGSEDLVYPEHHGFADFADTDFGVGVAAKEYSTLCRGVFLNSYLFFVVAWQPNVGLSVRRRVLELLDKRALTELPRPNCSIHLSGACMTAAAVVFSTLSGHIIFDKNLSAA
jgi:hypothetical protein